MRIATCSYDRYDPSMGLPVRITVGAAPRGLPYLVRHHLGELAPDVTTLRASWELFRSAYLRKLEAVDVDEVRRVLRGIALTERADPDTTTAVLLTHADLSNRGAWCHRTLFAAWWAAETGELVPELGGLPGTHALNGPPADGAIF